jgi:hypothetical protein
MTAAEQYAAQILRANAQQSRLQSTTFETTAAWDRMARMFRADPRRPFDPNLVALAAHIKPTDVVVDVGGGAGRVGLALARSCTEVVNAEPSVGMGEQFTESAVEAGIKNARLVTTDWLDDHRVVGDVTVVCNVTYFVPEIVRFLQKLIDASRRRVVISVWSVPPPNQGGALWPELFGEEYALVPGHKEILAVLWEMGILPDVQVLPGDRSAITPPSPTRESAIDSWLAWLRPLDVELTRSRLTSGFDRLFVQTDKGFAPTWRPESREMLITWETNGG